MDEAFCMKGFQVVVLHAFVTFLLGNWGSHPMWYQISDIFSWGEYLGAMEMVQSWPSFFVRRRYPVAAPFLDSISSFYQNTTNSFKNQSQVCVWACTKHAEVPLPARILSL